jgi:hypothetical protein
MVVPNAVVEKYHVRCLIKEEQDEEVGKEGDGKVL